MDGLNQPIVIDQGSGTLKAGFAGADHPSTYFPSYVGASDPCCSTGDRALHDLSQLKPTEVWCARRPTEAHEGDGRRGRGRHLCRPESAGAARTAPDQVSSPHVDPAPRARCVGRRRSQG